MEYVYITKEQYELGLKENNIGYVCYLQYILNRIYKEEKNFLQLTTGPTGSGKSLSNISMAEMLSGGEMNVKNIVFNVRDLVSLIRGDTLKRGSVVVMEEVGIDLSRRSWQSKTNNIAAGIFQTIRSKGYIFLFNVPAASFFDTNSTKLLHAWLETERIIKERQVCLLSPKLMQINEKTNKIYYKCLRAQVINYPGNGIKVTNIAVPKPSIKLLHAYEKKKAYFQDKLYKQYEEVLYEEDKKKRPKPAWICNKCGYIWVPRAITPLQCSRCRSTVIHKK